MIFKSDRGAGEVKVFKKAVTLNEGEIFGELALIAMKKRAATVTCLTDCHFAVLDQATFRLIKKQQENMLDHRVNLLKEVPFFREISRRGLMKCSHYFKEREYYRNQVVMREGDRFDLLHLIIEGEFELSKQVEFLDPTLDKTKTFDYREFLPHTEHSYCNQKNDRYVQSVDHFKHRHAQNPTDNIRISVLSPFSFVGLEEATQDSKYNMSTLKCTSQRGRTYAIPIANFELMVQQKYYVLTDSLHVLSAQQDLKVLDMIENRGMLKKNLRNTQVQDSDDIDEEYMGEHVLKLCQEDRVPPPFFNYSQADVKNIKDNSKTLKDNIRMKNEKLDSNEIDIRASNYKKV